MRRESTPIDPKLLAAILSTDLCSFIEGVFPIVSGGGKFLPNWHIEAIAHQLNEVLLGNTKRLIITVPPRNLKSICASVCFPAFVLGLEPNRRIICVSYSDVLAKKHANDCRAVMRSKLYRSLFPGTCISSSKDTETEFETTRRGSRFTTSVGGTLTGRGGSLVIIDDPMKPQDANSESARESVKQWFANTMLSRLDQKKHDAIVIVMQRLHPDDLAGHLLEQGGWTHLNLPAIAEEGAAICLGDRRFHIRPGTILLRNRDPLDLVITGFGSARLSDFDLEAVARSDED